ncbi:GID complex subunit 4, VID24 [Rhizoclosmatium sp. JEL0117]|nr:GID complex subunit 4, VID24 [Rhizoclosmatium sp. JEL0117]
MLTVALQHVDLSQSYLCGYLNIQGLTEEFPELCTFFEAEIIGHQHSFLTRKWDADEKTDRLHWTRFPNFSSVESKIKNDNYQYDFMNSDMVYMRWKEHFLVPDHKIKSISGASFAGFYYIAFQKSTESITGFYFHQNSEMFQHLQLKHVGDGLGEGDCGTTHRGTAGYEFA